MTGLLVASTYVLQVLGCGLFVLGLVVCAQAGRQEPCTGPAVPAAAPGPVVVRHRCRGCAHAVDDHDPGTGRCSWVDCRCSRDVAVPAQPGGGAAARGGDLR